MSDSAWQVFSLEELSENVAGGEPRFHEFLRVPTLSSGVYRLPAGSKDMQAPHLEDEVYVVLEGRARLRTGDTEPKAVHVWCPPADPLRGLIDRFARME